MPAGASWRTCRLSCALFLGGDKVQGPRLLANPPWHVLPCCLPFGGPDENPRFKTATYEVSCL